METIQVLNIDFEDMQNNVPKNFCIQRICEIGTMFEIRVAFLNACMNGMVSRVEYILEKSKIHPSLGIVWACRSGHIDVIKILLKNGADPNFVDEKQKNWTPMIATMIGNNWGYVNKDEIVSELIKYGAVINKTVFDKINAYIQQTNYIKQSNFSDFNSMKYIF